MPKKVSKRQFLEISRDIKQYVAVGTFSSSDLARQFKVSRSTINTIRRAKTYPGFLALKSRRHNVPDRAHAAATKQLSDGIKELELNPVGYVTKKQLTDAIDSFDGKIRQERIRGDMHRKELDNLRADTRMHTRILNRVQQLKPRWFRDN
jgi:transposase